MSLRFFTTVFFLLTGIYFHSFDITAQHKTINNLEISLSVGNANIECERFKNTTNLDWLNYVGRPIYNTYELVNWDIRFGFLENFKTDISLIMENDFTPITFKTSVQYYFNNWFGFHSGLRSYNTYIESATSYFSETAPDYYYQYHFDDQRKVYNISAYCGPAFYIKNKLFKWTTTVNIGLSFQDGFNEHLYRKTPNSNEDYAFYYKIKPQSNCMYGFSSLFEMNLFKINNKKIGLLLKADYQNIQKQTNYELKRESWLGETDISDIKGAKHVFMWKEWDAGIYLRF